MQKKIKRYLPLILMLIFVTISITAFAQKDNTKIDGIKNEIKNYKKSDILVKGDGIEITQADLNLAKFNRQDNLDDTKILEILIENKVLLKKAKESGISVSKDEMKKVADEAKENIKKLNDPNINDMIKEIYTAYGLTEEQYWDTIVVEAYSEQVAINMYKEQLYNDFTKDIRDEAKKEKIYKEKLEKLISYSKEYYHIKHVK